MDALQFKRQLRDQVLGDYKQMMEMDDVQRQAFEAQEENEFLKHKMESESKLAQEHREMQEQQAQLAEYQEALGVDEDQWNSLAEELSQEYDGEITPDAVGQYAYAKEVYSTAESLLSQIDSEAAGNDDIVEAVADMMLKEPELTQDDLLEIITDGLGIQQKRKPSKKATASAKKPSQDAGNQAQHRNKLEEFYSFDQFDD